MDTHTFIVLLGGGGGCTRIEILVGMCGIELYFVYLLLWVLIIPLYVGHDWRLPNCQLTI